MGFRRIRQLLLPLLVGMVIAACAHHVHLVNPNLPDGTKWVCRITEGPPKCDPVRRIDPTFANDSRTAFITLPRECEHSIQDIIVRNAHTSHPEVYVTCGAIVNDASVLCGEAGCADAESPPPLDAGTPPLPPP